MQKIQQEKVCIHQFPNGLQLVYLKWNTPVAHTGVFIPVGSRHELKNEQGIAHFIEHTIFKGTEKRNSVEIINCLEQVGGDLNAYTGREETVIHASILSQYTEKAFDLLSDIVFNSTFPEKELEKEKEVVIDEIKFYLDTPDELIFDDFEEQLFPNQPFGRNILGTPEGVSSFTQTEIQRFIERNYAFENMVISYVGNRSFEEIIKLIEKYFIQKRAVSKSKNIEPAITTATFQNIVRKTVNQSHCILGGVAPSIKSADYWAMSLLNNYIGGPAMNSVLNMALREKHGYTYSNGSNYTAYSDTGIIEIYLSTDLKNLQKSLKIVEKELDKIQSLKQNALVKMQNQMCGQIAVAADSGLNQMLSIGKSLLQTQNVINMDEVFESVKSISLDSIHQVTKNYLNFKNLSQLIYEPDENE